MSQDTNSCPFLTDLSILDELFPTLSNGDSTANCVTNQLAFLRNTFGTIDEEVSSTPSLFNPLQLSPPRLNEIHALATANLISQTQEAIMQEYNISEFDFDKSFSYTEESTENSNSEPRITGDTENACVNQSEMGKDDKSTTLSKNEILKLDAVDKIISDSDPCSSISYKTCHSELPVPSTISMSSQLCDSNMLINFKKGPQFERCHEKSDTPKSVRSGFCTLTESVPLSNEGNTLPQLIGTSALSKSSVSDTGLDSHTVQEIVKNSSCEVQSGPAMESMLKQRNDDFDNGEERHYQTEKQGNVPIGHKASKAVENQCQISSFLGQDRSKQENPGIYFVCVICLKRFDCVEDLENHSENHMNYSCPHPGCIRTFNYRSHLSYHKLQHAGNKQYQCHCGKSFTKAQHLKTHEVTHTNNKPFMCIVCQKSFLTAGNLKNHSRVHTGDRPYVCDVSGCDKSFTESSSLKKHKITHTGEKPYKCEICGKGFTQASSRAYHMKKQICGST